MYKRFVVGRGACKHPQGRACPSREFVINGIAYYFCQGWRDSDSDDLSACCSSCNASIFAADDFLQKLIEDKEKEYKKS